MPGILDFLLGRPQPTAFAGQSVFGPTAATQNIFPGSFGPGYTMDTSNQTPSQGPYMNAFLPAPARSQNPSGSELPGGGGVSTTYRRNPLGQLLGVVGDALLMQHGNRPIYEPYQEEAAQRAAIGNFTQDPLGAVQRLAQVPGGMPAALKLWQQYQTNQMTQGYKAAQTANLQSAALVKNLNGFKYVGGIANTVKDQATWDRVRPIISKIDNQFDLGIGDLPEKFDPSVVSDLSNYGTSAYQQQRIAQFAQGLQYQGENAESNRIKATASASQANTAAGRLSETNRHNTVTEGQGQGKLELQGEETRSKGKAREVGEANTANKNGTLPPPRWPNDKIRDPASGEVKTSSDGIHWD